MFHFFQTSRHFCFRTAIDNHRFLCSQTTRGTYRIHRCISTTDYSHSLTECHRSIGIFAGCIHQVHTCQIFIRRHDVDGVLTRNVHEVRQSGTRSNEDSLETFTFEVFHTDGLAYDAVLHESHSHLGQVFDFHIHNLVRQTEFRNTIFQYPTNFMQRLEHSYIVTHLSHIACKRQSGRS